MARVVLESGEGIDTPHFLASMIVGYRTPDNRADILAMVCNGFSNIRGLEAPADQVFHQLLLGKIPYKVDNGIVVFYTEDVRTK